ncbi:hypothetical protein E4T50_12132 [Aureobasidium sp. EXF-12298]|nr:hypothetical protein E4T50_12132 [Aureobasidium sp. EXF-12298]KAI4775598.1 hypothetical protein E4T52_09453 [Aureobasidium sp. EXF-3400]
MLSRAALSRAAALLVRQKPTSTSRPLGTLSRPRFAPTTLQIRAASHVNNFNRWLSTKSAADEAIEEITELYSTARDEVLPNQQLIHDQKLTPSQFEMAMEETENKTIYAEADREAAREELTRVQEAYNSIVEGADTDLAEEVKRRIGQRIRELEAGVKNMEDIAMNQD